MRKHTQYSASNIFIEAQVDPEKWNQRPSADDVAQTIEKIQQRGITVIRAQNSEIALEKLKDLIPPGSEIMNGTSTTLLEIGYDEYVNNNMSQWNDLHKGIIAENDEKKRHDLRRKSVTADYFISGVNAIARSGEIVACDKSGSRVNDGSGPVNQFHLPLANSDIPCGVVSQQQGIFRAPRRVSLCLM